MVSSRFDENEAAFVDLIRHARSLGLRTVLHCEDARILAEAALRLKSEGKTSLRHFPESRPVEAEARAVQRAVGIAEAAGAPIYIVHLSSKAALEAADAARERGIPVAVRPALYSTSPTSASPARGTALRRPAASSETRGRGGTLERARRRRNRYPRLGPRALDAGAEARPVPRYREASAGSGQPPVHAAGPFLGRSRPAKDSSRTFRGADIGERREALRAFSREGNRRPGLGRRPRTLGPGGDRG
jgi:hypothetical protein